MRCLLVTAALAATAALLLSGQDARASVQFGVQDDAWLRWGPGTLESRLNLLDTLGVRIVRFTLVWREVAPTEPAHPTDPNDPAYDWHAFDPVMHGLRAHRITALVTIWGSPGWANGGHGQNFMPARGFGNFAYAAARRYPWVRLWTVWNEPNLRTFAVPVSPSLYVRHLLNPAWAARAG
jgi:beta-glucosidase/6-phospho-beta-glucosidase/beta-galactosidase